MSIERTIKKEISQGTDPDGDVVDIETTRFK